MKSKNKLEKNLGDIITGSGGVVSAEGPVDGIIVTSVEYDSRRVGSGSLFVAVEGYTSDGHDYISAAVEKGAPAVVLNRKRSVEFSWLADRGIAVLLTDDTRKALALVSAAFFGFPSKDMVVVGITGTNGKTSITYMLENILETAGIDSGVIGTVNYRWKGKTFEAPNTTPESRDLQQLLARMKEDGVRAVFMEVSSHALELSRAAGIEFDAVVFTNLTGDHLDFHGDIDSYFKAKKKIFSLLQESSKPWRFGVVNIDDEYGDKIAEEKNLFTFPMYTYGCSGSADYRPVRGTVSSRINGLSYILEEPLKGHEIRLMVAGRFHVHNSLAAFAVARNLGLAYNVISRGLADLKSVPGRFDVIVSKKGFSAVVDYAHTADALLKLLESVRELSPARIITVFGCGGDRDRTKRPVMGKTASEHSDVLFITSDNPRKEDPEAIIRDIIAGIGKGGYTVEPDRRAAIRLAVESAREGDVIVIAGKGHEDYQIIGAEKTHFDDREVAREFISMMEAR
ncbi:MAG TPA: UDP-N-acetylmuramoyl-L-alanyl-D-glutamate--2,6-diaminopimelate ligase, partial [Spirochaetota bacterium]|nr:UDP-N-acetylmuramoyl-L-alanyl-D-glutamate--2,6-diaminopimelate ligase [Spirochaetota bacterium]HRZ27208.1 UDP-N-acetylmuramoyl-L-alanyl-D-glutamate--2,6-diaminopimelate ligase [Spirochaetota bacterium]HSA15812.1 UDP-N-acetylmuramoyl-L-alanyl-D-glutamate--2,6-diaminopimelate ligase [Spirochaetota bacterium]